MQFFFAIFVLLIWLKQLIQVFVIDIVLYDRPIYVIHVVSDCVFKKVFEESFTLVISLQKNSRAKCNYVIAKFLI